MKPFTFHVMVFFCQFSTKSIFNLFISWFAPDRLFICKDCLVKQSGLSEAVNMLTKHVATLQLQALYIHNQSC